MRSEALQLRFDGGHQQRYFSSRRELLDCLVRIAGQSRDPRYEVWAEGAPVVLADGREAGKCYELVEVIDLTEPEVRAAVEEEFSVLHAGDER